MFALCGDQTRASSCAVGEYSHHYATLAVENKYIKGILTALSSLEDKRFHMFSKAIKAINFSGGDDVFLTYYINLRW
jgi:hypothetical protein